MKRMDRYEEENTNIKASRAVRNQELYQNIGNNTRYASITDVTNANATVINPSESSYNTREDYQKLKKYSNATLTPKVKKDLEEFNNIYNTHENRVYDINNILEEARKNREEDSMESKRRLKNASYNILANMTEEDLEKYRQEKKERLRDDSELKEIIDTIASKTLAGELEVASDLLSDLMATTMLDKLDKKDIDDALSDDEGKETTEQDEIINDLEEKIHEVTQELTDDYNELTEKINIIQVDQADIDDVSPKDDELNLSKEILAKEDLEDLKKLNEKLAATKPLEEEKDKEKDLSKDEEFYTRSMDLSKEDFELEEDFQEKKLPLILKIFIIIIILVAVLFTYYYLKLK